MLLDQLQWSHRTYLELILDITPLDKDLADDLGRVFGTSSQSWLNLERSWRTYQRERRTAS
jgi:plasmid maintenance system antidote protein VapI